MRRKFLSVVLCVCMMLTMVPFAFATGDTESNTEGTGTTAPANPSGGAGGSGSSTENGITSENALESAISSAANGATVKLDSNIVLTKTIVVDKNITLDMDGHTLSNTQDIWNESGKIPNWSFISVQNNGDLTITGNGTFKTKENDCYAVDIQDATAKCTIENGTFVGNIHAIYVFEGSLFVNGGTYSIQQKYTNANQADEFVLNCYDANRRNGSATISVSGGSFVNFNPANCQAEGIATNFCADGYTTTSTTNSGETIYTVGTGTNSSVANAGANYNTLQSAINSVEANSSSTQTVTLLKDVAEDITIPSGKTLTLDLNGKKLTNVSSDTITVASGAKLTITGEGTVDNVTHGKADIYNNGTVILNGGNYTRSQEAENTTETSGGNSYYNILNHGDMTIDGAVKVLSTGHFSSLVANGYYSYSSTNPRDGYVSGTNQEKPNLTIKDGSFSGGINTIKNDDAATLTINGGTFTNYTQAALQNHGTATVTAGSFTANSKYAIDNCGCDATLDPGKLEISGGTFNGTLYIRSTHSNVTISDGYFNGSISKTGGTLTISGGYFTIDPSTYVVEGKSALPGSYVIGDTTYNYKVDKDLPANVEVIPGKTEVDATNLSQDNASKIANSAISNVSEKANEVATSLSENEKATKEALNEKLPTGATQATDSNTITTVVSPRLNIAVTSYDPAAKTLTLDVKAVYDIKATTNPDGMVEFDGTNGTSVNTVTLKKEAGTLDTTGTPVTLKFYLPDGIANEHDSLFVIHTKSTGEKYVHAVTVQKDSNGGLYVEFVNDKGFSTFSISAVVAASITTEDGTTYYETLQDAVNAVQNGETIKLEKNCDETATVSRAVNFTLDTNGKTFTDNISAGSRYSLTKTNGEGTAINYTVTYVGGGSSSGTPTTSYNVNINAATNGAVAADKKTASKGTTVTVTASPSKGYVVDAVKVVDKDGKNVAVTEKDGKYVFTMPASAVTVTGSFKAETPAPVALPFTDVKSGNWFYDAVKYAYAQGLMTGTSATTFAPNGTMNRAMIVTVLYRLEKSPAVTGASKFTDVPAGQWYSDAVAWAAANKIVNGYDETTFGPMNAVTREQMAAILFRYEQVKGLENVTLEENLNRFPDQNKISAYAIPALQWAVGQKIINGNANGTLDPTGTATRAQVAQIFTNLLNK